MKVGCMYMVSVNMFQYIYQNMMFLFVNFFVIINIFSFKEWWNKFDILRVC